MKKSKSWKVVLLIGLLLGVILPSSVQAAESVPAENINVQSNGSLTIHALRNLTGVTTVNNINNKGQALKQNPALTSPMAGVTFTYARISRDQAKEFGWDPELTNIGQNISRDEALGYFETTTDEDTATTGTDGNAKINFSNLDTKKPEDNLYIVLENTNPIPDGMVSHPEPFIINVPVLNPNYDGSKKDYYNYDVHIYPKFVLDATSVQFDKVGEGETGADMEKLAGARFVIKNQTGNYLAKDSNGLPVLANGVPSFTATKDAAYVFTSTKNGVNLTGLPVGSYVIQELQQQPSTGDMQNFLPNNQEVPFSITADDVAKNKVIHPLEKANNQFINYKKPTIEKEIDTNSHDQFAPVTYTLTMNIPGDIGNYKNYQVKDQLSEQLDYVSYEIPSVSDVSLKEGSDFSFSKATPLVWNFTAAGRANLQKMYDAGARTFTIKLVAQPNSKAQPSEPVENGSSITFDNNYVPEGTTESNKVYTIFGGVKFKKVDDLNGKALAGAKFAVRRMKDGKTTYLVQSNNKNEWVADQKEATEFVSGADGTFAINGLAYTNKVTFDENGQPIVSKTLENDYALIETAAPNGYALLNAPLGFNISNDTETKTIPITNAQQSRFPMTGGTASALLAVGGALLLIGGFFIYRRQEAK